MAYTINPLLSFFDSIRTCFKVFTKLHIESNLAYRIGNCSVQTRLHLVFIARDPLPCGMSYHDFFIVWDEVQCGQEMPHRPNVLIFYKRSTILMNHSRSLKKWKYGSIVAICRFGFTNTLQYSWQGYQHPWSPTIQQCKSQMVSELREVRGS